MHTSSKILISLILVIMSFGMVSAAEPANNLNKSLAQIQREFPDCIFWCESGRGKYYKSAGEGFPIMFEIRNGKVVSEMMIVDGEGNFAWDWFANAVNAFSKSDYKHVLPSDSKGYHFFYTYFTVFISYDDYSKNASITYELLPEYVK